MRNLGYLSICLVLLLFGSCASEPCITPTSNHTLLIYMAADNNLGDSDDLDNLDKMYRVATRETLRGGRLIVFHDSPSTAPTLFEIKEQAVGKVTRHLLKSYNEQNSASGAMFATVLKDVKALAPANSYGLVMWSHGSGWLPSGSPYANVYNSYRSSMVNWGIRDANRTEIRTRAFGLDGRDWGEINEYVRVIPDRMFTYILFDACFMGEIEVAYAFRNKTRYLIASAAEIVAEGMPYDLILADCFAGNYDKVCQNYYNYYNAKTGWKKTATISLSDCSQMEALAEAYKPIAMQYELALQTLSISNIQRYDRNPKHTMFDAQDMVATLIPDAQDLLRKSFEAQLSKVVLSKYNTDWVLENFRVKTFCGLSIYAPLSAYTDLNPDYYKTEWHKAVH